MCDIWDSAHICTSDRLTSGSTSCTHSRALFSDKSTNQEGNLWHFIVVSRFLSLYFKTANFWTWSAAAACLCVWIFSLLFSLHVSEVWEMERMVGAREDARWLLWNNAVAPILRKLESVAAGTESGNVQNRRSTAVCLSYCFSFENETPSVYFSPMRSKNTRPGSYQVLAPQWVWSCHRPCGDAQTLVFTQGRYLFYPWNNEKTPPFSSSTSRLFLCCPFFSLRSQTWKKEEGCFFFKLLTHVLLIELREHGSRTNMLQLQKSTGVCVYTKLTTHTQSCVFVSVEVWKVPVHPDLNGSLSPLSSGSAEASVDRLCDLCHRLHGALEEAAMLGRSCARRSGILRTLFRLVDLDSAGLSLQIAELCLAVSFYWVCGWGWCVCGCLLKWAFPSASSLQLAVSGNNLLNICKLIFQISRSESNDVYFQRSSFIGEHTSAFTYCDFFLLFFF